ncbi:MAG: histidine kinase [Lachnospiraceae bacterium]|nr:histidine kinase [Lachnospiraceae bacterium]
MFYTFSYQKMEDNYQHLCISKAAQIKTAMVMLSLNVYQLQSKFTADPALANIIQTEYKTKNDAKLSMSEYSKINSSISDYPGISAVRMYVDKKVMHGLKEYNGFYPIDDNIKNTNWYNYAKHTSDGFWLTRKRIGTGEVKYYELNYYCRISLPQKGKFAILSVTISNDYLRSLIDQDQYNIYITADDNVIFFASERKLEGQKLPTVKKSNSKSILDIGNGKVDNKSTILSFESLKMYKTNCNLKILVSNDSFYKQLHRFIVITLSIVLIAIIISFSIVFYYNKYFSDRIKTLRIAMHKAANNDYEIVNSIHGNDELSQTFSDLKVMAQTLKKEEMSIYQNKIAAERLLNEQQQMEMKLLAGQINPHFLYNTLEMLRMKALTEGNRSLSKAIQMLGKCMHYVLSNTKSTATTLQKEITYLENYLSIMKMRFGNRLNYDIRIDSTLSLDDVLILPLLIQPVVENAIIHGLEETGEPGLLVLKIKKMPHDKLLITVYDNGIGMDKNALKKMRRRLNQVPNPNANHGVAMYNINTRIHLYYGKEYGVKILSKPQKCTFVSIKIPLQTKGEE